MRDSDLEMEVDPVLLELDIKPSKYLLLENDECVSADTLSLHEIIVEGNKFRMEFLQRRRCLR